jgi:hypothetical protein
MATKMPQPDAAVLDRDALRRKAAQCLEIAARLPPGEAADQLLLFAKEYAELAQKMEEPGAVVAVAPSATGA